MNAHHPFHLLSGILACCLLAVQAGAQSLPQLENSFRNTFSEAGAPADPEPPGPTARTGFQFASGTAFGGWVATRIKNGSSVVAGSTSEAPGAPGSILNPKFTPVDGSGAPIPAQTIQLVGVVASRTMVLRSVSYNIGGEIPRPDRKPDGTPLADTFEDREFYFRRPANADTGRFYYSPHADKVFASEPGIVTVDWEERVSGNIFTQTYTISGSPVKPTKKLYWTERERGFNGPLVTVPAGRVGEVNVIYNALFPESVPPTAAHDYNPENPPDPLPPNPPDPTNPPDPPGTLPLETRTVWYGTQDRSIHAYNIEGRVLIEFLGDLREPARIHREHLGFEIVDVIKETRPGELAVAIGERVLPVGHGVPRVDPAIPSADYEIVPTPAEEALVADVVAGREDDANPYVHEHLTLGGTKTNLYAVRTTRPLVVIDRNGDGVLDQKDEQQSNEVLIYWKEAGVQQLLWPKSYIGYIIKWPEEYIDGPVDEEALRARYALYARPELAGDLGATGVQLNSSDNPSLVFQDDPTRRHATLSPQGVFVTDPANGSRSLIRYTDGEAIWFERVYSRVNTGFAGYGTTSAALVGTRIEPPDGAVEKVGYIRQTSGTAFNPNAYQDPFAVGFEAAAAGAIIPVNALAGNNVLEIWWYEQSQPPAGSGFSGTRWPSQVSRHQLQWPVTDPDDANPYDEIVLARNDGSGDLGPAATGTIYRQADSAQAGYNPNEEHALMSGGVAWALRDDLNLPTSSEPFVLVEYTDPDDGRPAMKVFRVVRENATDTFDYDVTAGTVLQAPMPLPILPPPLDENGVSLNKQTADTKAPSNLVPDRTSGGKLELVNRSYYENYVYTDRKGTTWIYRGPHEENDEGSAGFAMHYHYPSQAEFDYPGVATPPAPGANVNYLRPYTNGTDRSGGFDAGPAEVRFRPFWPKDAPLLTIGETLTTPKRGLPAVRGQSSVRVLYDQAEVISVGDDVRKSVVLHDPTRARTALLSAADLTKIPESVMTSNYQGKTYFPALPPHLSKRFFFDRNLGPMGGLSLVGEFVSSAFGEDYLDLNTLSEEDILAIKDLCASGDPLKAAWDSIIAPERTEQSATFPVEIPRFRVVLPDGLFPVRNLRVYENLQGGGQRLLTRGSDYQFEERTDTVWGTSSSQQGISVTVYYEQRSLANWFASSHASPFTSSLIWPVSFHDTGRQNISLVRVFDANKNYQDGRDFTVDPVTGRITRSRYSTLPSTPVTISFYEYGPDPKLVTTMETLVEDKNLRGQFKFRNEIAYKVGPAALAEITVANYPKTALDALENQLDGSGIEFAEDDIPVDSYALTAVGGGTGYVVLAMGDSRARAPEDEPVSIQVIRVAPPGYRGELKVLNSANPLDEKSTLRHSGDFAATPQQFEFQWLTGQPVSGFPPALFTLSAAAVLPNGPQRSWAFLNNPGPDFAAARSLGFDDSGWPATGDLGFNELVINNGEGTVESGVTQPHALLREEFARTGPLPESLYLSLEIDDNDGAVVYLNGAVLATWNVPDRADTFESSAPAEIDTLVLPRVFRVPPEVLQENNTLLVELYTAADAGARSRFDLRLDGVAAESDVGAWQVVEGTVKDDPGTPDIDESAGTVGKVRHIVQGASLLTLTDNYFIMRYRALPGTHAAFATGGDEDTPGDWTQWTSPQLLEGWIKRALGGLNPFEQRLTDLFNNAVNTDVSLLTQAGARWEGDIALTLDSINDFGLIEIYETILRRGRGLSIDGAPPLNVPAANDALLLAAGYLNDLYMLVGNEAFADAANPTIAFDTEGGDFGEFNTALFAFKGQLASVLDEELTLLRGRDASLQPGVEIAPIYNRLVWNFTGGINSGQPIYSLNYNVQDNNTDGTADAADAAVQYPQGHGDAYGHYLTALKVYYNLLRNPKFAWEPRIEAVSVLGQPVSIDYQDERKFATAAAALARTASQVLDLTYRQQFTAREDAGWEHLSEGAPRHWGTDEWACRGGQGAYFHWVTANSVLPAVDDLNEGIQKVDRTTVPELDEVVAQAEAIQETLDNADGRLNPLGLAKGALSFDISPSEIDAGKTHYEQVYERALGTLKNAVFAFNSAKRSTEFLRSQDNNAAEQRAVIDAQEQAFENQLIELYGTPYPDDIGPGRTYVQGYAGPDLLHYAYVELPEASFDPTGVYNVDMSLDLNSLPGTYRHILVETGVSDQAHRSIPYRLNAFGEVVKPGEWTGRRAHPGQIQTAYSDVLSSRLRVRGSINDYSEARSRLVALLERYATARDARAAEISLRSSNRDELDSKQKILAAAAFVKESTDSSAKTAWETAYSIKEAFPRSVGFSNDATSIPRGAALVTGKLAKAAFQARGLFAAATVRGMQSQIEILNVELDQDLAGIQWTNENAQLLMELRGSLNSFSGLLLAIDGSMRDLDQTERDLQAAVARGEALQRERETFRKRAAAIIQGYRTRDLAFRVFRDESLEKYKTLFDLAARYTYLAARAYDYETGLLDAAGSSEAASFYDGIVRSRALGVVDSSGNPQFTASSTGDPGLAGVLAAMQGDWSVAKSRLGFNNPDNYETTFSLRQENFRIIPGEAGHTAWRDRLAASRMDNILSDPDVRRYCMQVANANGMPVPGLVIPIQTTIGDGINFFGQPLAGGDHTFTPSSFATKIRSSGIAFKGYIGMDSPTSTSGAIAGGGGTSPPDPNLGFLDPEALSATPFIYLIPAGVDSMRSPPLGDTSIIRQWSVEDQAIPLPFNIGNSDFSDNNTFLSADSLSETPFAIRKHQAFRAVPSGTVFGDSESFTNSRLIGRSAWNSNWKLVIPGKTLLANPDTGLDVFIDNVTDIELFLRTYSYSGN